MRKKIFSLMLMAFFFMLPLCVSANSGTCGEGVTWAYADGTLTISGTGVMTDYTNTNHAPWWELRQDIKTIVIEDGITQIGNFAFAETAIETITLPESISKTSGNMFRFCEKLTEVNLPETLTALEFSTFYGCSSLENIEIPESVTSIGAYAFSDCSSLESIIIPDGVTNILHYVFRNAGLKSIHIPKGVTSLHQDTFTGAQLLEEITVSDENTMYSSEDGVLYDKQKTKLCCYPYGKKETGYVMPSTVSSFNISALNNNRTIENITISDSITAIDGMLSNCLALKNIYVSPSNTNFSSVDGVLCDISGKVLMAYPCGRDEISFNQQITEIGSYAFNECRLVENISIPYQVTKIGEYAFYYCTKLKSINLPANLKSIEDSAFFGCSSITEANYCGSAEEWEQKVNVRLNNDNITDNLKYNVPMLKYYNDFEAWNISFTTDGVFTLSGTGDVDISWHDWWEYRDEIKTVIVEEGITSLPKMAFYDEDSLAKVSLPSTLTSIGNAAFGDCDALEEINIPETVTYMGTECFRSCDSLKSLIIPDGITNIPYGFMWYVSADVIYIPKSVTNIEQYAFYSVNDTLTIYYSGTEEEWNAITVAADNRALTSSVTTIYYETEAATGVKLENPVNTENGWNVDYKITNAFDEEALIGTLYVAMYDKNNALLDVKASPISLEPGKKTGSTIEFTSNLTKADYIKAFVWSNDGNLTPLLGYKENECYVREEINHENTLGAEIHYSQSTNFIGVQEYTYDGDCEHLELTFTDDTYMGVTNEGTSKAYDKLIIYDGDDNVIGEYTEKSLAGRTIKVPGKTVKLYLRLGASDRDQTSTYYLKSFKACKKIN